MYISKKKYCISTIHKLIILLLLFDEVIIGQDLVKNGSFEEYYSCPDFVNQLNNCKDWWCLPNFNTPDFFVKCYDRSSDKNIVGVPKNYNGIQEAASGKAYVGIITYCKNVFKTNNKKYGNDYSEYIQTQLIRPMISGHKYLIEMKISLADYSMFYDNQIDICLSADSVFYRYKNSRILLCNECIRFDRTESFKDTITWQNLSFLYTSTGDEQFLTIGEFYRDGIFKEIKMKLRKNRLKHNYNLSSIINEKLSYYYIDDVHIWIVDEQGEYLAPDFRQRKTSLENDFVNDSIYIGKIFELKNVYFEFDKSELLPESESELNMLAKFLKENRDIEVEIIGHTDYLGTDEYNLELSKSRAKLIVDYLIRQGVEYQRLYYKGYGKSKPVADNNTDEGRAKNRRVEFMILKK